ncbi:MAG: hypothetical protein ABSE76_00600 [Minisyncoccia bacterium]|jgi:hypothetical protein
MSAAVTVSPAATQFVHLGDGRKDLLVKFFFTNPRYLPDGLPTVPRLNDMAMDRKHQDAVYLDEDSSSAEVGRHREGRVDTGIPVIENLQLTSPLFLTDGLEASGFYLVSAHYYRKEAKGKFGKPSYVIVLHYSQHGERMRLSPELAENLLRFYGGASWTINVWNNPGKNPTTVNLGQPSPDIAPRHELIVDKGVLRAVHL